MQKKKNISGKGAADTFKARKELVEDSFLAWLDPFTHLGQTRANLLPSADNAGGEILNEIWLLLMAILKLASQIARG